MQTPAQSMSDTSEMFFGNLRRQLQAEASEDLQWLRDIFCSGSLRRHTYLRYRRFCNRRVPWWTTPATRNSWNRFNKFEGLCTVTNVSMLLAMRLVSPRQLRQFCRNNPLPELQRSNIERALAIYTGQEDHLATLKGALANPDFWSSLKIAGVIQASVGDGTFRQLWLTGYFDQPHNRGLLDKLQEHKFIDFSDLVALQDPTELGEAPSLPEEAVNLNWFLLTNLLCRAEA